MFHRPSLTVGDTVYCLRKRAAGAGAPWTFVQGVIRGHTPNYESVTVVFNDGRADVFDGLYVHSTEHAAKARLLILNRKSNSEEG